MPDALQLLRDDHEKVKEIFKQFEEAEGPQEKQRLVKQAIMELEIHSKIEEDIFYPAVEQERENEEMMGEAREEHHAVDLLIAELKGMRPTDERYDAKFTVLSEMVKHHIQEEESEMLPKAAEKGRDLMARLGEQMEERKMMLQEQYQRSGGIGRTSKTSAAKRPAAKRRAGTRGRMGTRTSTTRRTTARRTTASANGTRVSANGRQGTARRVAGTRSTGTRTGSKTRASGTRRSTTASRAASRTNGRAATGARATGARRTASRVGRTAGARTRSTATRARSAATTARRTVQRTAKRATGMRTR